jgi:hypothetical protein
MATFLNAFYGAFLRQFFAQDAQVLQVLMAADLSPRPRYYRLSLPISAISHR